MMSNVGIIPCWLVFGRRRHASSVRAVKMIVTARRLERTDIRSEMGLKNFCRALVFDFALPVRQRNDFKVAKK
jgi:hypothetical protein